MKQNNHRFLFGLPALLLALSVGFLGCPNGNNDPDPGTQAQTNFTVTYNGNGSTGGTVPASETKAKGTVITAASKGNLELTGKVFNGWNTAANGSGTKVGAGASYTLNADVTFYAQWLDTTGKTKHKVTYDKNGATSGTVPTEQEDYEEAVIAIAGNTGNLALDGKVFKGWNTAANGSGTAYAAGDSYTIGTADITLYAKWDTGTGDNPGGTGGEDGSAKPAKLDTGATWQQTMDKLDAIIAYCEKHPGTVNTAQKSSAETTKTTCKQYQDNGMWAQAGGSMVTSVNTIIDGLDGGDGTTPGGDNPGGNTGDASALVAKWYDSHTGVNNENSASLMYEFTTDGKLTIEGRNSYDYTVAGNKITLIYGGTSRGTADFSISGTVLTITNGTDLLEVEDGDDGTYYKKDSDPNTINSLIELDSYLKEQTGGAAADAPLKLTMKIYLTEYRDIKDMFNQINGARKYVDLDLSACTIEDGEFWVATGNGSDYTPDSLFYIVSLVLPAGTTEVENRGSQSFTNLKEIKGHENLTYIGYFFRSSKITTLSLPKITETSSL